MTCGKITAIVEEDRVLKRDRFREECLYVGLFRLKTELDSLPTSSQRELKDPASLNFSYPHLSGKNLTFMCINSKGKFVTNGTTYGFVTVDTPDLRY